MGANMLKADWAMRLAGAAVLVSMGAIEANAGAFAIHEQSTVGQGDAFAGVAAGGAPSSMFWNPATMTQTPGFALEANGTGILSSVDQHPVAGSTLLSPVFGDASDTGSPALLVSGYTTWQINPNLWLGLSANSPFGLSTSFPDLWAGRNYALSTSLMTYNATPSVALRINEWLSVGLGVQIQFGTADLNLGTTPGAHINLDGSGWGFGLTAGVTVTPGPNTTIGVGWRSAVDQKIDGSLNFGISEAANTTLNLPDIVSVGLRHRFDDRWTIMGTAEWTNWSRIGTSVVNQAEPALLGPVALPFQFRDGWFYSVGAEYVMDARTTLRGGVAYEVSPITDHVRIPILPDNNRIWLSAGASYKMLPNFVMDVGYSHIWVKDSNINISAASGNPWFNPAVPIAYVGNASASLNIFSVGFRYMFAPPPPVAPLLTKG
jgi:long-chain fatty acid transport protein